MIDSTSASLLAKLKDPSDQVSWEQFVRIYTPLVRYWLRRVNLQSHDVDDVLQQLMVKLVQKLPEYEYDPERSFRGWLRRVVHNEFLHLKRSQRELTLGDPGNAETTLVKPLDKIVEPEDFWSREYADLVVALALPIMRDNFEETTWRACWLTTVDGEPAAAVAEKLGLSVGAVYIAKSRVLQKLREELAGLLE